MRSLRSAVLHGAGAAFVAVFAFVTADLVPHLTETYWAPIAAVVVLYPESQATKKAAFERFVGTILGSTIGWACAVGWDGNVLVYGLGILVAVALCDLLKLEAASRLCAVAVTVITIIPRQEPASIVALHRFFEVTYGVACALAYTWAADWIARRAKHD